MKPQIGQSYIYSGDVVTVVSIEGKNAIVESNENGQEIVKLSKLEEVEYRPTYGHHDGPMFGYGY